ncbi:MAG: HNH endonuclease [Bacteroidetes bacterium]|nr:HNH endonuclease [Bacteroidota bacterium]
MTQLELVLKFFEDNPNRNIETAEVVDQVTSEHLRITGRPFRDPDRVIRSLYSRGILQKIRNGCYRYDPSYASQSIPEELFTQSQKEEILRRGEYRCAMCGITESEGAQLHVDHMVPRSRGGDASIDNGQVLCSRHNNLKKNYGQTETCKRMYQALYQIAEKLGDRDMLDFIEDVMKVYDKHEINSHIDWKPKP